MIHKMIASYLKIFIICVHVQAISLKKIVYGNFLTVN